jgi:2-dehydro-3-deoxygluconokinase
MTMALLEVRPGAVCRWDLVVLGECGLARTAARAGLKSSVVTALLDNPDGRRLADELRASGVGDAHIRWITGDVQADHAGWAAARLKPGDVPWSILFAAVGARWFHVGGAFATLSGATALVAAEAMETARRCGTIVSYDLASTGLSGAGQINARLASLADVVVSSAADVAAPLVAAIRSGVLGATADGEVPESR